MTASGDPVFVLGPERSGTSLVAWSLAQHKGFSVVQSSPWLGRLATQVVGAHADAVEGDRSHLGMRATTLTDFTAPFAAACQDLLRNSSSPRATRWVDHTSEAALHVAGLAQLFAGAKFIHVVRDIDETISLLTKKELSKLHRQYYSPHNAYEHWLRVTRACITAERALRAERVLRMEHAELLAEPDVVMKQCLEFLGEDWDVRCVRPLRALIPLTDVAEPPGVGHYRIRNEAKELFAQLMAEPEEAEADGTLTASLMNVRQAGLHGRPARDSTQAAFRELVQLCAEDSARVAVVSRGDDELVALGNATGCHFPSTADGRYAGYHPADSEQAIGFLNEARGSGATHLAFPATSSWWLTHYTGLRDHLAANAVVVGQARDVGVVFDLRERPSDPPAASDQPEWEQRLARVEATLTRMEEEAIERENGFWATEALSLAGIRAEDAIVVLADSTGVAARATAARVHHVVVVGAASTDLPPGSKVLVDTGRARVFTLQAPKRPRKTRARV
jgi:hypothetical protein